MDLTAEIKISENVLSLFGALYIIHVKLHDQVRVFQIKHTASVVIEYVSIIGCGYGGRYGRGRGEVVPNKLWKGDVSDQLSAFSGGAVCIQCWQECII